LEPLGHSGHFPALGLSYLSSVDTCYANTVPMNMHCDAGGISLFSMKDARKYVYDKLHGGKIVVVKQYFVHWWALCFGALF